MKNTQDDFWSNVNKTDGCWEWKRAKNKRGYGVYSFENKKQLTHRLSYMFTHGELPSSILVCHKCDNPKCVNPDHLFAGTQTDNMNDMVIKGSGRNNYNRKISIEDIKIIRAKYPHCPKDGTVKELAKKYGINESSMTKIINRKTYKHI